MLVDQHRQMRKEQPYLFRSKEIVARHLKVWQLHLRQFGTYHVGILIGIHDDGRCLVRMALVKHVGHVCHVVVFRFQCIASQQAEWLHGSVITVFSLSLEPGGAMYAFG